MPAPESSSPFTQVKTLAFVSDIHGNLPALRAVLEELKQRDVNEIYAAGDLLYGGEDPLGVWRALQDVGAQCTQGLSDLALSSANIADVRARSEDQRSALARFEKTRHEIGELILARLRRLPTKLRVPLVDGRELLMVHGSPREPTHDITHDMSDDELAELLADDPADIVVCGSSHLAFVRELEGVRLVSVGSVGSSPEGRVAHYTLIRPKMGSEDIEQLWVDY